MPRKGKAKAPAKTLDELGGAASNVHFVRTDARAAAAPAPISRTKLKHAFEWQLGPQWPLLDGEEKAKVLAQVGEACAAEAAAGRDPPRPASICVGRAAVTRTLRRGELRALVLAQDSGPPLLYAHLAPLAQERGAPACVLACSSAQLGQPFGLLRASAVGLRAEDFGEEHELVQLLRRASEQQRPAGPLPWLENARAGLTAERTNLIRNPPPDTAKRLRTGDPHQAMKILRRDHAREYAALQAASKIETTVEPDRTRHDSQPLK